MGGLAMGPQYRLFLLFMLCAVIVSGCAGERNPVLPAENNVTKQHAALQSSHNLFGYFLVEVEEQGDGDYGINIIPVRYSATHWNILSWLEQTSCADCLSIRYTGTSPEGNLLIDVSITHPFDNPNLTGYDVRGIAIFDGSGSFPEFDLNYSDGNLGDGEVVNADGFTTLYNVETAGSGLNGLQGFIEGTRGTATLPNSKLNGYKQFNSEDSGYTFLPGDTVTVGYEIDMPDNQFVFGYAVDASWTPPSGGHMEEPYRIDINVMPVGDGVSEGGGESIIEVTYYHHNVRSCYSPHIECPALFDGILSMPKYEGSIYGYSPQVHRLTVVNTLRAKEGDYPFLVRVESMANYPPDEHPWLDLSTYQFGSLHVAEVPVVALASAAPNPQGVNLDVTFSGADSYDPDDGEIVNYEWDWDNDGTYEDTGIEVQHSWDTPGVYEIQLRVTDDQADTGILEEPLKIWIELGVPAAPVDVTPSGLDFIAKDIVVRDPYAYVSVQDEGVKVLDISVPESAMVIESFAMSAANRMDISNDLLCVEDESGIFLLDVSDPYNVIEGGVITGTHTAFATNGDYLYILDDTVLRTWDIDPPSEASKVNQVICGYLYQYGGEDVATGNDQAIVVFFWPSDPMLTSGGVQFFDISSPPASPKIQELIVIPGGPTFLRKVRACDSYAILGRIYGNQIWDISDPGHAYIVATIDELTDLRDADFTEGEAYMIGVNNEQQNVLIYDLAPPEETNMIGSVEASSDVRNLDYSNGYLYMTTVESGVEIWKLW